MKAALYVLTAFVFIDCFSQDRIIGVNTSGGTGGRGSVFSVRTDGSDHKILHSFSSLGSNPRGALIKASDGLFYGMTRYGGKYNHGTIFQVSSVGVIKVLRHLNSPDGIRPEGGLVEAYDKNFYGMTFSGGTYGFGTVFKISPAGVFKVIHHFRGGSTGGANPKGTLILSKYNSLLYGVCSKGGANSKGIVFRMSLSGSFLLVHSFSASTLAVGSEVTETDNRRIYGLHLHPNGAAPLYPTTWGVYAITLTDNKLVSSSYTGSASSNPPLSNFIKASDGNLYCLRWGDGTSNAGTISMKQPETSSPPTFTDIVYSFNFTTTGGNPTGDLCDGGDGFLYGATSIGGNFGQGTIFKFSLATKQLTVIRHLKRITNGGGMYGNMIKNTDGFLYGMTSEGGGQAASPTAKEGYGCIFKINTTGTIFTVITQWPDATLGLSPRKNLWLARDGNYYGTTSEGGKYGAGIVYKLTSAGVFNKINSFHAANTGANPYDGPIQASDGNFYGTTLQGGANGRGTIYKMTTGGIITVLRHFSGTDGSNPQARLMQASDGYLYGTASSGGTYNSGTVFRITLAGAFNVVRHMSAATDGSSPQGHLYQADPGGAIYGTARTGGANGNGTVFKISGGVFSVIRHMGNADGKNPYSHLVRASDGVLYGLAYGGGLYSMGTLFRITPSTGVFRVVVNFQGTSNGRNPYGGLVEGANKTLYGTTSGGGSLGAGVVFRYVMGGAYSIIRNSDPATGNNPMGTVNYIKSTTSTLSNSLSFVGPTPATTGRLYPNPVANFATLEFISVQNGNAILRITDMEGRTVLQKTIVSGIGFRRLEIDCSAFAPGAYIATLQMDAGLKILKMTKQ